MSGVVDVGDEVEVTFSTTTGATVTVSWLDPDQATVIDNVPVTEDVGDAGNFTYTFLPTSPGVWTAQFTASGTAVAVEKYFVRALSLSGLPPLASVGDVAAQYGSLTPPQETLTRWLLRAASKMIRAAYPTIDAQLAAGTLDGDIVALAITNMILRVLRNPKGLRSETVGPFSRAYDTTVAAGLLIIGPDETGLLTPPAPGPSSQIGTIRLGMALAPGRSRHGW